MGADKPSKAFFDACFAAIPGFRLEETVMVGDSLTSDIRGGIEHRAAHRLVQPPRQGAPAGYPAELYHPRSFRAASPSGIYTVKQFPSFYSYSVGIDTSKIFNPTPKGVFHRVAGPACGAIKGGDEQHMRSTM